MGHQLQPPPLVLHTAVLISSTTAIMSAVKEESIREQLLTTVDGFLLAQRTSESAMESFNSSWNKLQDEIITLDDAGSLSTSLLELAETVASTVDALCQSLMTLHLESTEVLQSSFGDPRRPSPPTPSPTPPSPSEKRCTPEASHPPLSESCWPWLRDNLHNPYPPSSVKASIASQTGSSIDAVADWFSSARRRVGWTKIQKTHFSTRKQMVDAATVYFHPPHPPVDTPFEINTAFALMAQVVRELCCDKSGPSHVAEEVAGAVKHLKRKRSDYSSGKSAKRRLDGIAPVTPRNEKRSKSCNTPHPAEPLSHATTPSRAPKRRSSESDISHGDSVPNKRARRVASDPTTPSTSTSSPSDDLSSPSTHQDGHSPPPLCLYTPADLDNWVMGVSPQGPLSFETYDYTFPAELHNPVDFDGFSPDPVAVSVTPFDETFNAGSLGAEPDAAMFDLDAYLLGLVHLNEPSIHTSAPDNLAPFSNPFGIESLTSWNWDSTPLWIPDASNINFVSLGM
uniref:Homeodomain 1 protein n=1 Tax=Flammulina velutipes TaxID=38945 RepID=A0A1B2U6U4_FLAVE|nr:homeodomain 1 protein [Flammulina velutipes]